MGMGNPYGGQLAGLGFGALAINPLVRSCALQPCPVHTPCWQTACSASAAVNVLLGPPYVTPWCSRANG